MVSLQLEMCMFLTLCVGGGARFSYQVHVEDTCLHTRVITFGRDWT